MPIVVKCRCGRVLKARDEFAGTRAECPTCGALVQIPLTSDDAAAFAPQPGQAPPTPVKEFFDPPRAAVAPQAAGAAGRGGSAQPAGGAGSAAAAVAEPPAPVMRRMFEALLDPRSIQWMLMIGGGLCVLGVVVWLVSQGVFDNKWVMAAALGVGTLALLGAGWFMALGTRYRVAGQALTFLGCVVAPLNLWFYHAQDILTVDGHLWVGGVVCCLLFAATVYVLRDPLFMYACEAGVTLTAVLLLADLGKITSAAWLSLFLMALGLISIHAERAFSPAETSEFPRRRYGLPLFWSGHVQLGAALAILLASQLLGWFVEPATEILGWTWQGSLLTRNHLLAAAIWFAAAYAYLYSDIVVRRIGVYFALAGFALMMGELTLLWGFFQQRPEWIIAALAATSLAVNVGQSQWSGSFKQLDKFVPPLGLLLGFIATMWGAVLHVRATSAAAAQMGWGYPATGSLAAVMIVAALANRASAFITRRSDPKASGAYFFLSAAGVLIAAAAALRLWGFVAWSEQAPIMMLIPVGYMLASRAYRGQAAERPFYWIAQIATATILLHVFGATLESWQAFAPMQGQRATLLLGLVFAEAAAFYVLAAIFHRRSVNVHLAAAAACAALWQLMGYCGVPNQWYTMLYAGLGVACLVAARALGLDQQDVYRFGDRKFKTVRGRGLAAFQCGNGILCVALLAALMQGLSGLAHRGATDWTGIASLAATIAAALCAAVVVPAENWRRFYGVAAVALGGVLFLRLNMLLDLTGWQKLEIFCVVAGVAMLAASHVARFREATDRPDESVSFGLAMGSLLAAAPLLIAVLTHRWMVGRPSLWDEFALLTVTILMTVTGVSFQIKATTIWGAAALAIYLAVLVVSLAYHPTVAVGVYLAVGGAAVFGLGVALSVYRDKLLALPEQVANREGVFRILNWR